MESKPGATGVIYLDFDGEAVPAFTRWNNGNPINCAPSGFSNEDISLVWEIVAEDYSPFDINVTTNRSVYDGYQVQNGIMVILTPTNTFPEGNCCGIGGGNTFANRFSDDPAFVFNLSTPKVAGDTASHEAGHAFSLVHLGKIGQTLPNGMLSEEYYAGHNQWNAIMGAGTGKSIVQWSLGEYDDVLFRNGLDTEQDPVQEIAGIAGFATDDHGSTTNNATALIADTNGVLTDGVNKGIIEKRTDLDMFSFVSATGEVVLLLKHIVLLQKFLILI